MLLKYKNAKQRVKEKKTKPEKGKIRGEKMQVKRNLRLNKKRSILGGGGGKK